MSLSAKENETTRASLELLYHVSRELALALDLRTVLERVLFLSMRNTRAIRGSIIVIDDTGKPVESVVIVNDQQLDTDTRRLRIILERGLAGWVLKNKQPVLVLNTNQDERWLRQDYEVVDSGTDAKSAVSAPLTVREKIVGVITLVHHQPNYFSEDHLALLQAIADQSGIAVLNASLYAASQRQVKVMTAMADAATAMNSSLNLEDVFSGILEKVIQALSVEGVCLALLEPGRETLVVRAARGWRSSQPNHAVIQVGQGFAGWVAKEGQPLIVQDALQDERYDSEIAMRTGLKIYAVACAPLIYRGETIGILEAINPKDGLFDTDTQLLLAGIGSTAGTALQHALLFEQLQAAHQSYRELFDDSIDPIFITDSFGKILEANRQAQRVSGCQKDVLRGMSIGQLHSPDQELVGTHLEKISASNPISYESRLRSLSGHELPIQVTVRQVMIDGNPMVQWICRDITERIHLDRLRDDLISMVYHDLRSPLANIVSSLDILSSMLPDDDLTMGSLVNIALRSTERIQRLTNSLLDMSRLEAGQPVGNRQNQAPLPILKEAFELVKPVAENKQQPIVLDLPDKLPRLNIDGEMIHRVLVNLLENASKYSPAGTSIQLGARENGNMVHFWVHDHGPGIPASEHERIFTKFSRLGAQDSATHGLGLGLAYCRLAVEAHQGKIWVESEPGKGTRFCFSLPIASSDSNHNL